MDNQADKKREAGNGSTEPAGRSVEEVTAGWPARPRLAIQQMTTQYGPPLEVSSESVIWHNAGQFKRIMVTKKEIPHDFPKPHMDFLEHTISYDVPAEKVDDLVAFDASITINKTAGEMSARCDLEGHNILTLNLARDLIDGKKSVEEAREAFGKHVVEDVLGKHPKYVEELQFSPEAGAAFLDQPTIPGSPVRGTASAGGDDAEVLAYVIAMDDNVVLAASAAHKKQLSSKGAEFAQKLHEEHGKHQAKTMALGQKIGTTPVDTMAVDQIRVKGAGDLADLVPLDGHGFETAYVDAMVKSHTEALSIIQTQLLGSARSDEVKEHLTATGESLAKHLEDARALQS